MPRIYTDMAVARGKYHKNTKMLQISTDFKPHKTIWNALVTPTDKLIKG